MTGVCSPYIGIGSNARLDEGVVWQFAGLGLLHKVVNVLEVRLGRGQAQPRQEQRPLYMDWMRLLFCTPTSTRVSSGEGCRRPHARTYSKAVLVEHGPSEASFGEVVVD